MIHHEKSQKDSRTGAGYGHEFVPYGYRQRCGEHHGGGTFNPNGNITGYEVLAMALRAIGYGKNHEFEGAQWQINTAAWARREGLLDGVSALDQTRLDQPASRGMVFQVLFNAIQHEDVGISYVTTDLYDGKNDTMANRLKMEKVTGVVVANEWAALDDTTPAAKGKTRVEIADGAKRTLNDWSNEYQTALEEIGLSYDLYIYDKTDILYKADSGLNVIADNEGAGMSVKDAAKTQSLSFDDAEYYVNYGEPTRKVSDWLIRYVVDVAKSELTDAQKTFLNGKVTAKTATLADGKYTRTIKPGDTIESMDITIMNDIFYTADRYANNPANTVTYWVYGEVYAGTSSLKDLSDVMTWKSFKAEYLLEDKIPFTSAANGEWLRVISNDGDSKAEYVLKVEYVLDEVVETRSDKFYYRALNIETTTPVLVEDYSNQAVSDIVLYAVIDGNAYVQKADSEAATISKVNYKDETATDTEGTEWKQSGIYNETILPGKLVEVSELTPYTLYLDRFGYVRAYDGKVNFALLTEMYPTTNWNSAWVVNRDLTAEAMLAGDTAVREYPVINSTYNTDTNPFCVYNSRNVNTWSKNDNNGPKGWWNYPGITNWDDWKQNYSRPNYLQPATHMLGTSDQGFVFRYERDNKGNDDPYYTAAEYHTDAYNYNWWSWTNVAKYTQTENGLNLYSAADEANNVRTDYIRLQSNVNVSKTEPLFSIEDQYYDEVYTSANSRYVRAVDSTIFYLVTVDDVHGTQAVRQFTGYQNVPSLTFAKNDIRSMYAVAHTNLDNDKNVNQKNYWVADVIVIEMRDWTAYESIALVYSNNSKITSDVKYVQALDSVKGNITIIPNAYNVWNGQFDGLGFYGLNDVIPVEGQENTYTATLTRITDDATFTTENGDPGPGWYGTGKGAGTGNTATNNDGNNYNKNGIYYGQVRSDWSEDGYSNYITLDVLDHNGLVVDTRDVRVDNNSWKITADQGGYTHSASSVMLRTPTISNKVEAGDKVLWVETQGANEAKTAGFLVDLTKSGKDLPGYLFWNTTEKYTVSSSIAVAQWNGHKYTNEYTYMEIIGKRNDQTTGGRTLATAPEGAYSAFVVDEYDLYLCDPVTGKRNAQPETPVYSESNSDKTLWELHYDIPAGSIVTVEVKLDALMKKDLVLNSKPGYVTATDVVNGVKCSGIDVGRNLSWTFEMPDHKTDEVVVGTIFEDTTTLPVSAYPANMSANKVETIYDNGEVFVARRDALKTLSTAYTNAIKNVDPVENKELYETLTKAYTDAVSAIETAAKYHIPTPVDNSAVYLETIEKKLQEGLKALGAQPVPPTPDKVDDTDALKAVKAAYDEMIAKAKKANDTKAEGEIETAYTNAKNAIAAKMEESNTDSTITTDDVTTVGTEWAGTIRAIKITETPADLSKITINARLFGSTQSDVNTDEVKYYTFKAITVPAENGVFTLTKAQLDALEPNGFKAELTKVMPGDDYTVEANEAGDAWTITATKATITLEVDFDASSFEGSASDGEDNKGDEVDKDHVDGSGSGSGSVTIKPAARQTLSNVEVGKDYDITVTPDEDSVITALQFLKCKENSRKKVGEAWVCNVTILAEDWVVKFTAELKNPVENIPVNVTLTGAKRGENWADYVTIKVNDNDYTAETKLERGERYNVVVAAKPGLDADVVLTLGINGTSQTTLAVTADTTLTSVEIKVEVESLKDIKFDANAAIDAAVAALDESKLTDEQVKDIEAAVDNAQKTIAQVNTKALVQEALANFQAQLADILDVVEMGSSEVNESAKTVKADWYDEDKDTKLDQTSAMAIVNNNDAGKTFRPMGGTSAADFENGSFDVLDEDDVKYTVTLTRKYKVTIDGEFVGYVTATNTNSNGTPTLAGITDGLYFDADDTTLNFKNDNAFTAVPNKVYQSTGSTLTLSKGTTKADWQDVNLISGVKIVLTETTAKASNPLKTAGVVVSGTDNITNGTGNDWVRRGTDVAVNAIALSSPGTNEYRYELRKDDEVVREGVATTGTLAAYTFKAIPAEGENEINLELAGGIDVNVGGKTFFAEYPSKADNITDATPNTVAGTTIEDVSLTEGLYMVLSTKAAATDQQVYLSAADKAKLAQVVKSGSKTNLVLPNAAITTTTSNVVNTDGSITLVPVVTVHVLSGAASADFESVTFGIKHSALTTVVSASAANSSGEADIYVAQNTELVLTGDSSKTLKADNRLITTVTTSGATTGTPVESTTGTAADGKPTWTLPLSALGTYNFKVEKVIESVDLTKNKKGLNIDLKNGVVGLAELNSEDVASAGALKSWSADLSTTLDDGTVVKTPENFAEGNAVTGTITIVAADNGFFFPSSLAKIEVKLPTGVTATSTGVSTDGKTLTIGCAFTVVETK